MNTLLLHTKIKQPPLPPDLVARPRLVARLDERSERGLTCISAHAGFGKTTLLCEWCNGLKHPIAWVSLDENDNDLVLFLRYVIAALQSHFPNAFGELDALLSSPQQLPVLVLVTAFVNAIDEWNQRVILVLDDYHVIQNRAIHEFLSILIRNLPPNLHLVLATRIDPPLPLAHARARGNLVELRAADLRFSYAEVGTFLEHNLAYKVEPALLELLDDRVEGWAAGLRLASLSLGEQRELKNWNVAVRGQERLMLQFLFEQVLSEQSPEVQAFLLRTSLVERFCLPLSDALLEDAGASAALLDKVQRANLFLIPLDVEQTWFRYHAIFQELLRARLHAQMPVEQLAELHQRASEWFAAHGLLEEALRHALKANNFDGAARLIEAHAPEYLNRENWRTVERWLEQIPMQVMEQRPLLLLSRAYVWWLQWKFEAIVPVLSQVETRLERGELELDRETEQLVRSYLYTLRAFLTLWRADMGKALEHAKLAFDLAPADYHFLRGLALVVQAAALQALGSKDQALSLLDRWLEQNGYRADHFTMRLLLSKALVFTWENELDQTLQTADYLLKLAKTANFLESALWSHTISGRFYYERNQLEAAHMHFTQGVELRNTGSALPAHACLIGLALTSQALGRQEQATQAAERAQQFADENQFPTLRYLSASFEAHLALLQADLKNALERGAMISADLKPRLLQTIEVPEFTKLQLLIAEGSAASLAAAAALNRALFEFCTRTHNKYSIPIVLALSALLYSAQRKDADALDALQAAVESARSARRIRPFVDLGKPLEMLLLKLTARLHWQARAPEDEYLRQLLAAFEQQAARTASAPRAGDVAAPFVSRPAVAPDGAPTREVRPVVAPLMVERLTPRELQVLELLRSPLSPKEIARQLYISVLTMQTHTKNLYGKLGVNNRRQAVETAIALGILSPS